MPTFYAAPDANGDGLTAATPGSLSVVKALARAAVGAVTVYLRGGTYTLSSPLSFDAGDSGTVGAPAVWSAYQGETVAISGGVKIAGWTLHDSAKGIWKASVPAGTKTRHLWVNGRRAPRAFSHFGGLGFAPQNVGAQYVSGAPAVPVFARPQDLELVCDGGAGTPDGAPNLDGALAWWMQNRLCVVGATRVGNTTTLTTHPNRIASNITCPSGYGGSQLYFREPVRVENAYEFLAARPAGSGQFYLDTGANVLYYQKLLGEDMATADVRLPVLETLVECNAASPVTDIEFRGIVFEHTGWTRPSDDGVFFERQANIFRDVTGDGVGDAFIPGAVTLPRSQRVKITRCVFRRLGGQGLVLDDGAAFAEVTGNIFTDISSCAMRVGFFPDFGTGNTYSEIPFIPVVMTSDVLIESNYVHNIGAEYAGAVGIHVGNVKRTRVLHNHLEDIPYGGISLGWSWFSSEARAAGRPWLTQAEANEIAYNRLLDVMHYLGDGGGIYVLGVQAPPPGSTGRTTIHDNYVSIPTTATAWAWGDPLDGGVARLNWMATAYYMDSGEFIDIQNNVAAQPSDQEHYALIRYPGDTVAGTFATAPSYGWPDQDATASQITGAVPISGFDTAAWPAGAQAIVNASGLNPGDSDLLTWGGEAIAPAALSGSAAGHAAATATIKQVRPLAGSAAGKAATSTTNPANEELAATAAGDAGALGTLASQPPISGDAGGHADASAALRVTSAQTYKRLGLEATDGTAIDFGVLGWVVAASDGTSIGVGIEPTGYYGPGVELSGTAAGHAGATATPGVLQQLSGTAAGHADGQASTGDVGGTAAGHADAAGTLKQAQALGGAAAGHAGAAATGLQFPTPLAGTAAGHADATGDIQRVPLAGTASGDAEAVGTLSQTQPLAGTAAGHAQATAAPVQPVAEYSILGAKPIRWGLKATPAPHGDRPEPIRLGLKAERSIP